MPEILITINNRPYNMSCKEGQQSHIQALAKRIDQHIHSLVNSLGQVGDQRLLLMTALDLADELTRRARSADKGRREEARAMPQQENDINLGKEAYKDLVEALNQMSIRLEKLADGRTL